MSRENDKTRCEDDGSPDRNERRPRVQQLGQGGKMKRGAAKFQQAGRQRRAPLLGVDIGLAQLTRPFGHFDVVGPSLANGGQRPQQLDPIARTLTWSFIAVLFHSIFSKMKNVKALLRLHKL